MIFQHVQGGLRLGIDDHSREVIVRLLGELRGEVVAARAVPPEQVGEHMKRLFPSAYHDDQKLNDEYLRLTHGDIADSHIAAIDEAVQLLSPERVIRTQELERFVRALNSMRLVLGTLLDVSEDDDDSAEDESGDDASEPQREVYDYLGWLLHASLDELRS